MPITWILVTDARHARLFERAAHSQSLSEVTDFVYPYSEAAREDPGNRHGGAAKGHGRTAHSGTQFEPRTEADDKARNSFARQLADYLNQGVATRRCDEVALIASSQMLGALRPFLSASLAERVRHSVATDLTHFEGEELRSRILEAISQPA